MRRVVLCCAGALLLGLMAVWSQTAPVLAQESASADTSKTLKVATIERRPFAIRTEDDWTGFSIDLWRAMARELGLKYEFVEARTFANMLGLVERGEADAAIANISITSAREQVMDFSQPIFDSGLQILIRADGSSVGVLSAIFTWEIFGWIGLAFFLLFIAANLMWLFERRAQPYFDYPYGEGLWRSFWWALITIVNGGFEERIPRTLPARLFAVMLVVASLFIVSAFVAKITATLTVGELRSQIQSYTDLYGRKIGTTSGSTSAAFMRTQSLRFREFNDIASLFAALEDRTIDAVVHDAPILSHYAATDGRGRVRVTGRIFRPEKYGIALPASSPLVEPLNRTLLRLREDGTYGALLDKWLGDGT